MGLYWHWLVFGGVLMTLELLLPVFFTFWLACAAFLVAALLVFLPGVPFDYQVLVWAGNIVCLLLLWHRLLLPKIKDRTLAGMSREAILGQVGIIVPSPADSSTCLRFQVPILNRIEWECQCASSDDVDMPLPTGSHVMVVGMEGAYVLVEPVTI